MLERPTTILFVCRHGAAKSVLAAELVRRRAAELGLAVRVDARGLDPDDGYAAQLGVAVPGFLPSGAPRKVTAAHLATASTVVTFDLEPDELPAPAPVTRWDRLPPLSQDPLAARRAIESHVEALLNGRPAD